MQKFPLRMKDNDLLVTELYKDPNEDMVTALSVYLTPKTCKSSGFQPDASPLMTSFVPIRSPLPAMPVYSSRLFISKKVTGIFLMVYCDSSPLVCRTPRNVLHYMYGMGEIANRIFQGISLYSSIRKTNCKVFYSLFFRFKWELDRDCVRHQLWNSESHSTAPRDSGPRTTALSDVYGSSEPSLKGDA